MPDAQAKPETRTITVTLEEKDIKKIEKVIDNTITKYIENLPNKIWEVMDKLVLGALGFKEDSWHRIEIDRSNGREPFVAKLVDDRAKQIVVDAMAKHEFKLSDEFDAVMRKDYGERLQRHFDHYFDRRVEEHFEQMMKTVLNTSQLKLDLKVEVPKTKKELADPNHLANIPKLRDLILKDVVENDGKKARETAENE